MSENRDLIYWKERTKKFGEMGVVFRNNEKLMRLDNSLRRKALTRLVKIRPNMKILDVGTGAGYWAIECAKAGAEVTGLDFNEEILNIAAQNAQRAGVKVNWLQGILEEVPLPEDFFDLILSITCVQHITEEPRQAKAIKNILKSLRSDGIFVLIEDTRVQNARAGNYMLTYSQNGWINLVQGQGAKVIDFTGVSFLRFRHRWLPMRLSAGVDSMLGFTSFFKERAVVTAFAFAKN